MDMNIFDMLKVDVPAQFEDKKAGKSGTGKKQEEKKKEKKGKKTVIPKYKVNVIYTGYHEPLSLSEETITEFTEIELMERLSAVYPEFHGCKFVYDTKAENGAAYAYFSESRKISKGSVDITGNTRMIFGATEYDLASLVDGEKSKVDLEELKKLLIVDLKVLEKASFGFYLNQKADILVPAIESKKMSKVVNFPINVLLPGRGVCSITEEMYRDACSKEKNDTGSAKDDVSEDVIKKIIVSTWEELSRGMGLYFHGQYAVAFPKYAPVVNTPVSKNNEKIPVDGTSISLVFTKILLEREMFDGAEEVTPDDIIRVLSKEYPEYSKGRTEITYDKKNKLVIPILKGSRKGNGLIPIAENEKHAKALEANMIPYYIKVNGVQKRVEKTPFGRFELSVNARHLEFDFQGPKIPCYIKEQCVEFFKTVMEMYDTEAMLQLFYDHEVGNYFLFCPNQVASLTEVCIIRDARYENNPRYTLVMDIHSHGRIGCSFSDTDNADELGTRLYGVFYDLKKTPEFDLRAGCKGIFVYLEEEDIFENDNAHSLRAPIEDWIGRVILAKN